MQFMQFNPHENRDELKVSDFDTVYHPDHGQLCQVLKTYEVVMYFPIRFKDKAAANKWVEKGTIAELQEGLCNLGVGFSTILQELSSSEKMRRERDET